MQAVNGIVDGKHAKSPPALNEDEWIDRLNSKKSVSELKVHLSKLKFSDKICEYLSKVLMEKKELNDTMKTICQYLSSNSEPHQVSHKNILPLIKKKDQQIQRSIRKEKVVQFCKMVQKEQYVQARKIFGEDDINYKVILQHVDDIEEIKKKSKELHTLVFQTTKQFRVDDQKHNFQKPKPSLEEAIQQLTRRYKYLEDEFIKVIKVNDHIYKWDENKKVTYNLNQLAHHLENTNKDIQNLQTLKGSYENIMNHFQRNKESTKILFQTINWQKINEYEKKILSFIDANSIQKKIKTSGQYSNNSSLSQHSGSSFTTQHQKQKKQKDQNELKVQLSFTKQQLKKTQQELKEQKKSEDATMKQYERVQKESRQMFLRNQDLIKQNKKYTQQNAELKKELEKLLKDASQKYPETPSSRKQKRSELSSSNKELFVESSNFKSMTIQNKNALSKLKSEFNKLQKEKQSLDVKLEQNNNELVQLKRENNSLQQQLEQVKQKESELNKTIGKVRQYQQDNTTKLQSEVTRYESLVEQKTRELRQASQTINALEVNLKTANGLITTINQKLQALTKTKEEAEEEFQKSKNEILGQMQVLETEKRALADQVQEVVSQKEKEIESLKEQIIVEKENHCQSLGQKEKEIESLKQSFDKKEKEVEGLKQEIGCEREKNIQSLAAKEKDIESLENQIALQKERNRQSLNHKQQQIEELSKSLNQLNQEKVLLEQQSSNLLKEKEELVEKNSQLLQDISIVQRDLNQQIEELREKPKLQLSQLSKSQITFYQQKGEEDQTLKLDPITLCVIDRFFQGLVLQNRFQDKHFILSNLESFTGKTVVRTNLLFTYDPRNKTSFHEYLDNKSNLLCVIKAVNGTYLAAYYSGVYKEKTIMNEPSLLISLKDKEVFKLNAPKEKFIPRGMINDQFYIIFGNSEIRLRISDRQLYSNFSVNNAYFSNRGFTVNTLLGEGNNRTTRFDSLEFYEIVFEEVAKKMEEKPQ